MVPRMAAIGPCDVQSVSSRTLRCSEWQQYEIVGLRMTVVGPSGPQGGSSRPCGAQDVRIPPGNVLIC